MKIWEGVPKVSGIYDSRRNISKMEKTDNVTGKKDVVSISNQAKDIQTAMKALKDIPDIRKDRVEELTQKLETGAYKVTEEDIADKILKSIIDGKA
ncbi:flagellar biosynthesis anti-sigma factor FlgM [Acetivibrio mesophilus]|uniref:Negative regulator of flagellin synthesis n=1 Tax=Acetivibrio mesophilus TaxID=2487273 RepID=A0A4Q0I3K1_9FIRM|nr:flagellar biosynthesis anti-sigma factor FlgM [Acetivibrio mesophilus]ODM27319.1 flagellar biosynthesis anti-sigma factor FlgM [Clostridium sp. Bc-iso-3]RXE58843.1 flagellar biosynthesis anti-sigma factor FlgM [Acetivibrio mesophilus]HHV29562.1 flagellar biosynthesis anti-sigma factor FlgM [Clostridium sp.]